MPAVPKLRAEPWLQSPLRTAAGELELAGLLENADGLDPAAMRVLGRYALVLIVGGRGVYRDARGTACDLGPGDAVLVFPDVPHAYGPAAGAEWTQLYFVFTGAQFDLWRRTGLLRPERPVLHVGAPELWQERLHAVLPRERAGETGTPLRALGRFLHVLADLLAVGGEAAHPPAGEAWLATSLRLLGEQRAGGGWPTPQAVARDVGLSYENFRKRFAQHTGEAPGQYQKRRRLERACAAIYHGERSIKQIAAELGFCDVFHFSKAFKQVVGATPSEYRRRVRGA